MLANPAIERGYLHPENQPEEVKKAYGLETLLKEDLHARGSGCPSAALLTSDEAGGERLSMENLASISKNLLEEPFTKHSLRPIHLAAIAGSKECLIQFIASGVCINAVDVRGWTALHHCAAAGNQELIDLLSENGADIHLRDDIGRTYQDILRFNTLQKISPSEEVNVFYADQTSSEYVLSAADYQRLTHSEYLKESLITAKRLIGFWKEGKIEAVRPELYTFFLEKYAFYRRERPAHQLAPVTHDSQGNPLPFSPGLGLFARKIFHPQDVLGEYMGLFASEYDLTSRYLIAEGPDARLYSNETSRINDGLPNAALVRLPSLDGMPYRRIFIALEEIRPGEQIIWNYGPHPVKQLPYLELRPRELRHFLREVDLTAKANTLDLSYESPADILREFPLAEKIRYMLQTPQVLFKLIFEDLLQINELHQILRLGIKTQLLPPQWAALMAALSSLAAEGLLLKARLQVLDPKTARDFAGYLASLTEKTGFLEVLGTARGIFKLFNEEMMRALQDVRGLGPDAGRERAQNLWKKVRSWADRRLGP